LKGKWNRVGGSSLFPLGEYEKKIIALSRRGAEDDRGPQVLKKGITGCVKRREEEDPLLGFIATLDLNSKALRLRPSAGELSTENSEEPVGAQDTGRMRFASSARSTNKVQLGIPQTASTSLFYATLSLSIFLSRMMHHPAEDA